MHVDLERNNSCHAKQLAMTAWLCYSEKPLCLGVATKYPCYYNPIELQADATKKGS